MTSQRLQLMLLLAVITDDVRAHVELIGAGATAPATAYIAWMAAYRSLRRPFVDVRLDYHARGSGFGKRAITSGSVSYAGSDSFLSAADYEKNRELQMFPSVAMAIVLAYNIPGVKNLVLTREQIVGIYNGSIRSWSDPTFAEHNLGISLPNAAAIAPVARYESSGSTEIFTRSLSSFSDAWASRYGIFSKADGWNDSVIKLFAERNSGMADTIRRQPYRIGYVTPASADEVSLPFSSIVNKRGRVTVANKRSIQAAMDERLHNMSSRLTSNLIDCEGEETYPIAGYSYFIVRMTHEGNCSVAVELARYIEWIMTSSQAEAEVENRLMVPDAPRIASRIRSVVLERMTCDGRPLMDLVRLQKYEEEESLKTWKLPVQIVTPLISIIILLLISYAIRQRILYLRVFDRDDWKISFVEIDFVVPKRRRWESSIDPNTRTSSVNCLGRWNLHEIVLKPLSIAWIFDVDRKVKQVLMRMREEFEHENIARFFGISAHNDAIYLVEQYCANSRLVDFIRNNKYSLNDSFRYVICADIANGMAYLHRQNLIHGNLSIDKCHVDSRWTIKIVDWEYTALYDVLRRTHLKHANTRHKSVLHFVCGEGSQAFRHLAPEIQKDGRLLEPTRAGDVYSFGIIVRDVFVSLSGHEQPQTSLNDVNRIPAKALHIMELACHETSVERPTFEQLEKSLRSAVGSEKTNFLDSMIEMIEDYTSESEERLHKNVEDHVKLVKDGVTLDLKPASDKPVSCEPADFINRKMAVMTLCLDSANAEFESDLSLVKFITEAKTSVKSEVIVVEEACNSIVVAVEQNMPKVTECPVVTLLALAKRVITKMTVVSPWTKLLAVVHVGSLSGKTSHQSPPLNNKYKLYGAALDECRQVMTEAATRQTQLYTVKLTKDAVDDDDGGSLQSLTLVPDSVCFTKYGELATLRVSDIEVSDNSTGDGGCTDGDVGGALQSTQRHTNLTNVDC